jgi:hypothetical protein
MKSNENKHLKDLKQAYNVPWITDEGYVDLSKYPIEQPAKDVFSNEWMQFSNACRLLFQMGIAGRKDAETLLFGLVSYYKDDIKRLEVIAENLVKIHTRECADFLFQEIDRVKRTNTTRIYINTIIDGLKLFPAELVEDKLWEFSEKKKFSHKLRDKLKEAAWEISIKAGRHFDL